MTGAVLADTPSSQEQIPAYESFTMPSQSQLPEIKLSPKPQSIQPSQPLSPSTIQQSEPIVPSSMRPVQPVVGQSPQPTVITPSQPTIIAPSQATQVTPSQPVRPLQPIQSAPIPNAGSLQNRPAAVQIPQQQPSSLTLVPGSPLDPNARSQTGATGPAVNTGNTAQDKQAIKTILINFNNVSIIEFIRFISKISGMNFIFDEDDLQFNVTIVSEEPTTIQNIMTALLQGLRIHNLTMLEQGNNIVIHKNLNVNGIAKVVSDNLPQEENPERTELLTRLFRLNTANAEKIALIVRPLVSERAIIEVFKETNHIIVTDLVANVEQIAQLIKALDAPNNGLVIGQYVVRSGFIDSLIQLAQKIMQPIAQDKTLLFVPHRAAGSIFIVSTPFLMERTMAMLQYLDQNQGITRVFDLKDLNYGGGPGGAGGPAGRWELDPQGNWIYRPYQQPGVPTSDSPPQGYWTVDENGNWRFQSGKPPGTPSASGLGGPEGRWVLDSNGFWVFQLAPGRTISAERLGRPQTWTAELPLGHIERTQFYIYKLKYRKGDLVQTTLGKVGQGLRVTGSSNIDLVDAINSVQFLETSNSLLFTGSAEALAKIQELLQEIDTPLRQVFIEVLILETSFDDSLLYSVNWGTRFGGGDWSGSQAFLSSGSPLEIALATTVPPRTPDAATLATNPGFSQGIVGRHLTHGGVEFNSLGTLVKAVRGNSEVNVVLSPKILTEDNIPAEIFVGINTQFPTQSVVNNLGVIVTQNYEYRDVGTLFRVTPLIGSNDVITLVIEEEVSRAITSNATVGETGLTTSLSRTRTTVHLPNECFLIISGMMQDDNTLIKTSMPCLGGVPIIGALFSERTHQDTKRNTMMFLRPKIIDTEEEMDNLTRHEQDIWRVKKRVPKSWKYESSEAMEFFNLPMPEPCCDDYDCECFE
jgi:type III secretion protein C